MKNYVVQPGDTLSEIAEREYGDASLYPVIARQNHLANPDVIGVGQQLLIPYVTRRHHFTTADSTAARKKLTLHYYLSFAVTRRLRRRPVRSRGICWGRAELRQRL